MAHHLRSNFSSPMKKYFSTFMLSSCIATIALAQSTLLPPPQFVPDARKPNRQLTPTLTPTEQQPAPTTAAPVAGSNNENLFSKSTRFSFQMEPANNPRMPSEASLMSTPVTLYKTDKSFSGSPDSKGTPVTLTLTELAVANGTLTDSARVVIQNAVVSAVNTSGIGGQF